MKIQLKLSSISDDGTTYSQKIPGGIPIKNLGMEFTMELEGEPDDIAWDAMRNAQTVIFHTIYGPIHDESKFFDFIKKTSEIRKPDFKQQN